MTDFKEDFRIPVPRFFERSLQRLLSPNQTLTDILDRTLGFEFDKKSNRIDPVRSIWNSKTMTLEKKKPITLDAFFSKVSKVESSDLDSSDVSLRDEFETGKNFMGKSTPVNSNKNRHNKVIDPKGTKDIAILMKEKNLKNIHSISESEDEGLRQLAVSPTCSEDLFAEESLTTPKKHKKHRIKEPISDGEIIPCSQAYENSSCKLSLGALPDITSITMKKSCVETELSKSPKKLSKDVTNINDSEIGVISSLESEPSEPHIRLSALNSIKKNMKSISEIYTEIDQIEKKFSSGDLTEDDDIYILQCPVEIDVKNLKGVKLKLHENSIVSLAENKYDCFSMKENFKRYLYVALPESSERKMAIGVYPLAGNIILSENCDIPFPKSDEDQMQNEMTSTECFSEIITEDVFNRLSCKKKKKKYKHADDGCFNEASYQTGNESVSEEPLPGKKKHKTKKLKEEVEAGSFSETLSTVNESVTEELLPLKKKHKKKKYKEEVEDESFIETISTQTVNDLIGEELTAVKQKDKKRKFKQENEDGSFNETLSTVNESGTEELLPLKKKHKKKKFKEEVEDQIKDEMASTECFNEIITEDVFNRLSCKKKKKKHKYTDGGEINSNMELSDFNKFLNIKTEWEDPQVIADSQETPSKSKKRKRKELNDSMEFTESTPEKKKKKRNSEIQLQADELC